MLLFPILKKESQNRCEGVDSLSPLRIGDVKQTLGGATIFLYSNTQEPKRY